MKAKLVSKWGQTEGAEHEISAEATIGRGDDNTIRINAKPVSSRHARIFFDNERQRYYIEDLGSLNGTELDAMPVSRAEPLGRLHVLRFAGVAEFMFIEVDGTAAASAAESDTPAAESEPPVDQTRIDSEVPELPAVLRDEPGGTRVEEMAVPLPEGLAELGIPAELQDAELPQHFLLAVATVGETRRFELAEGENVVGRSMAAKIRLSDRDLSRKHAVVILEAGRVTVRDLGSRNKTYVGGDAIEGEVELQPGDVVLFGAVEARLLAHGAGDTLAPPPQDEEGKADE